MNSCFICKHGTLGLGQVYCNRHNTTTNLDFLCDNFEDFDFADKKETNTEENVMTNQEEIKNKIKETINEEIIPMLTVLNDVFVEEKELQALIIPLVQQYGSVIAKCIQPIMKETQTALVETRVELFKKLINDGFSREEALQLVTSR